MQLLPITEVQIIDRQRTEIRPFHIQELKRSIISKGLLHPIVITSEKVLVAGECRTRAITELHQEALPFTCNGVVVPAGQIPITYVSDLSEVDLQEAELEENLLRAPLPWLDEQHAKARIHNLRSGQNAGQTIVETAREIVEKRGTGSVETERHAVATALVISANADNPRVKKAKNANQAYKALLDEQEDRLKADLIDRVGSTTNHTLIVGDCREEMKKLPAGQFDVILGDPPYGIDADTHKGDSKHFYDDSPDNALDVYRHILHHGFELCKPKASFFLFCDVQHFVTLRTFALQQGWVCWRTPLIFYKGTQGHAPWGRAGFVRTYETLLYGVKGQRELFNPGGSDVIGIDQKWASRRPSGAHAADKPVGLLRHLLSLACLAGDKVLDPCCGGGSIFEAATSLQLQATGIELDQSYATQAKVRMHGNPELPSGELEI